MELAELMDFVDSKKSDIISYRREFHKFPELGYEEKRTSAKVRELLAEWGIEVIPNVAKTGVVGLLRGAKEGRTVALRADMDALPIKEESGAEYKSQIEGKMHACGHDGHTAMLLGAARTLSKFREQIKGNIKFIFQPAEEGPSPSGAYLMVQEGVLEDVGAIFAIHMDPMLATGKVLINKSKAMAAADIFEITLKGKGGHAGFPHESVDAIAMAGQVINSLQFIVSREISPLEPAVISVGTIHGGFKSNVIASEVTMTGTIRTQSQKTMEIIASRMRSVLEHIAAMSGGDYEMEIIPDLPNLENDEEMAEFVNQVCSKQIGKSNVIFSDTPNMGSEDFAYYLQKKPGAFFWLGCGNEAKGINKPLHHPGFDIDENALIIGSKLLLAIALEFLHAN